MKILEKHGMEGTPIYKAWVAVKQRCLNPKSHNYDRYGGRGITVCDDWRDSFLAFHRDMGDRPDGMSIDRIDNNLGYFNGNCRWATKVSQQQNTSKSMRWIINGVIYGSSYEAAKVIGVSSATIHAWCCGLVQTKRGKTRVYSPRKGCMKISAIEAHHNIGVKK